jgi:hypothetical protein
VPSAGCVWYLSYLASSAFPLADLVARLLLTTLLTTLPIAFTLTVPPTRLLISLSSPKITGTSDPVAPLEITRVAEATQPQGSCTLRAAVKVPLATTCTLRARSSSPPQPLPHPAFDLCSRPHLLILGFYYRVQLSPIPDTRHPQKQWRKSDESSLLLATAPVERPVCSPSLCKC